MNQARVAPWKRVLGWASVLVSVALGVTVGVFLMGGPDAATAPEITDEQTSCFLWALPILGVFFLLLGAAAWALGYVSNGLVFTFAAAPVWLAFKRRIWVLNIAVQTCLVVGFGLLVARVVGPLLLSWGVQGTGAFVFPSIFGFLGLYAAMLPINLWAGLECPLILRSLDAKGRGGPRDPAAVLGISDATQSAIRKFFAPQDDVGVIALEPEELVFHGEKAQLRIPRRDLRITREGDAGNTAGLFGISHVVLRYSSDGADRAVRRHPIGDLTMGRYRRATDALESRLGVWVRGSEFSGG